MVLKCEPAARRKTTPRRQRTKADRQHDGHPGSAEPSVQDSSALDFREERLFRALDDDNDEAVMPGDLERVLAEVGLARDDQRISQSLSALSRQITAKVKEDRARHKISRADLCRAIRSNILLIERAIQGRMVIPDFKDFCHDVSEIFESVGPVAEGEPADYIPQLNVSGDEKDRFGVALCTVDGQRLALGDSRHFFSAQSTCKPVSYCLALEEHGPEVVHKLVGHEPSGASFNELALNKQNQPHNPMINAGAIMSCALIGLKGKRKLLSRSHSGGFDLRGWSGDRFEFVMDRWRALCGNESPRFSTSVFLSERETADRNYALGYFMREKRALPEAADLHDVLEFYIQCCAIELNAEMMSVIAATLANGGICPLTGERVFRTETVRSCLSLMSSCGMYDFSGEFAFTIGLPAKSGVSGAIMVVVPNVMGFCTWSPRLDRVGNSVRGIEFCRRLVKRFNFHNFDNLTGNSSKKDPRLNPIQVKARQVNEMIWAAGKGDLGAIQDQLQRGSNLQCKDYDLRTPLHLAAAENQIQVVRFFIEESERTGGEADLSPKDRWGGTPLDDAVLHGHDAVVELLVDAGAVRGSAKTLEPEKVTGGPAAVPMDSLKADELIWAASLGDLSAVRRLVAQGVSLDLADYDRRTAIHLAAAEGHIEVVRYLIAHGVPVAPLDRWGCAPLDDAVRHGRSAVVDLLKQHGGRRAGGPERPDLSPGKDQAA